MQVGDAKLSIVSLLSYLVLPRVGMEPASLSIKHQTEPIDELFIREGTPSNSNGISTSRLAPQPRPGSVSSRWSNQAHCFLNSGNEPSAIRSFLLSFIVVSPFF